MSPTHPSSPPTPVAGVGRGKSYGTVSQGAGLYPKLLERVFDKNCDHRSLLLILYPKASLESPQRLHSLTPRTFGLGWSTDSRGEKRKKGTSVKWLDGRNLDEPANKNKLDCSGKRAIDRPVTLDLYASKGRVQFLSLRGVQAVTCPRQRKGCAFTKVQEK